ncbi:MAG: MarR family winged helix-turn-helix transcriptional regulator [Peptococcaceae bacterium]
MDKRQQIMRIDTLFQQIAKQSSCWLYSLLPGNITPTQYIILKIISDSDSCKAADIAHILDISPAATTNLADRLFKNGWINRVRSDADRRIVWLELTENGSGLLKEIEKKRADLLLDKLKNLSNDELNLLSEVLQKILLC